MDYYGAALGPYRAAGVGPFFSQHNAGNSWLERQSGGKSWRRRRRGGGFFSKLGSLAKSAFSALKQQVVPVIKRNAGKWGKIALDHAVKEGKNYYDAFKKEGVRGVANKVLDEAPGLGAQLFREVAHQERGSGSYCNLVGTIVQSSRPELAKMLTFTPFPCRDSHSQRCYMHMNSPCSPNDDSACAQPFQLLCDAVVQQTHKAMPAQERGGFIGALLGMLGSTLAGGLMKHVIQPVSDWIRGKGIDDLYPLPPHMRPPTHYIRRGSGQTVLDGSSQLALGDADTVTIIGSKRKSGQNDTKYAITEETGGRGRKRRRVFYGSNTLLDSI
ncbi:MAG: LO6 [Arowana adomavirus]|uniref:LO6 n=1 Tax=Arowana adomavirus TaxID=2219223 RepID=A0A2U9Q1H6_9VIRU|nr:MAG: LO6 [Arowana adomavirus]